MKKPAGSHGPKDRKAQEVCDGCGKACPISSLFPIGDGSIKACRACYPKATSMVFTRKAAKNGPAQTVVSASRRRTRLGGTVRHRIRELPLLPALVACEFGK